MQSSHVQIHEFGFFFGKVTVIKLIMNHNQPLFNVYFQLIGIK